MNGSSDFYKFLEKGTFNRANLKTLYMVSGGLFTEINRGSDLIENIDKHGLIEYTEYLIALEKEDSHLVQFPRLKGSDDKTGIVIHFN